MSLEQDILCVCRKPYDPRRWMINCDKCSGWFHGDCIGISEAEGGLALRFYCPGCRNNYNIECVWRPKCRLADCMKPARAEEKSAFCSDGHARQFFSFDKQGPHLQGVYADEIAAVLEHYATFQQLKEAHERICRTVQEYNKPPSLHPPPTDHQLRELDRKTGLLIKAQQHVRELCERQAPANANSKTRRKPELCGFDPNFHAAWTGQGELSHNLDDLCQRATGRCRQHRQWAAIFERQLDLERRQLEGLPLEDPLPPDVKRSVTKLERDGDSLVLEG